MNKLMLSVLSFILAFQFALAQEYAKCQEFPLTSISPQGWIKEFLNKQASGLGGNPTVSGYPFNTNMWLEDMRVPNGHPGKKLWPYEQTGYFLDGTLRAGYLINNEKLVNFAKKNIEFTLSNSNNKGTIGFENSDDWSRTVFFRAIMAEYDINKSPVILDKLTKHYLSEPKLFNAGRELLSLEQILWLYGKTKNSKLLELAVNSLHNVIGDTQGGEYDSGALNLKPSKLIDKLLSDKIPGGHGVSFCEQVKIPSILYMHTGEEKYLNASINGMNKLKKHHILVDGCPSSIEHLSGKAINMAHETCDIIDLSWSAGYLLMATRDGKWADMIERVIFNAGLGSLDKDFKAHQYYSAPNQPVAADETSQFNIESVWGGMALGRMSFRTGHDTECCTGNIQRMMPVYAGRMWLKDSKNGGVVAALYGPSHINFKINDKSVTIEEETNYPFAEDINFTIKSQEKSKFPIWLRIPEWCKNAEVFVNDKQLKGVKIENGFIKVERSFKNNDKILLKLPMELSSTTWGVKKSGIAVERGPLVYALPVKSKAIKFNFIGDFKAGEFPNKFLYPTSDWNYALNLDEKNLGESVEVIKKGDSNNYPWYLESTPIVLKVKASKVNNWTLDGTRHAPVFPEKLELDKIEKTVELVPLGATYLRTTIFPKK